MKLHHSPLAAHTTEATLVAHTTEATLVALPLAAAGRPQVAGGMLAMQLSAARSMAHAGQAIIISQAACECQLYMMIPVWPAEHRSHGGSAQVVC